MNSIQVELICLAHLLHDVAMCFLAQDGICFVERWPHDYRHMNCLVP